MIAVTNRHGAYRVWLEGTGHAVSVGWAVSLEDALIEAEKELRDDLDDVQARLTAERDRLGELKHSDDRRGAL